MLVQIAEYLDSAARMARELKEWACTDGQGDISPYLIAYRAGEPVCQVILHNHMRDEILDVAAVMARGFDADVISMTHEAYAANYSVNSANRAINPMTGHEWGAGEMQDAAQNHDGIAKGWVREVVNIIVINRAADVGMQALGFHFTPTAFGTQAIQWYDDSTTRPFISTDRNQQTMGLMVDAMTTVMLAPSGSQLVSHTFLSEFDQNQRDASTAVHIQSSYECAAMLFAEATNNERINILNKIGKVMEA